MKASIHPSNLEKFNKKIAMLNKRVAVINSKSEVKLPSIVVTNITEVPAVLDKRGKVVKKPVVEFDIEGFDSEIKFNGWVFIGVIDHLENGNILRAAPKKEIPLSYTSSSGNCDHCKTKRARKSTAIIFNDSTGEYKQCGLKCVSFYTMSKSAEYYIELYTHVMDDLRTLSEGGGFGYEMTLMEVLSHTVFCAERFGIVTHASEKLVATTSRVSYSINPQFPSLKYEEYKADFINTYGSFPVEITDAHVEKAQAALKWISEKETNNSFINNLKVVAGLTFVDWKHFNLVCWIVLSYLQEVEKQEKLKAEFQKRENAYIGTVGEKIEVEAECVKCILLFENRFGITWLNIFRTKEGNTLTWKTSKHHQEKQWYKISSKVYAHAEYKETKQTEIKRAKTALVGEEVKTVDYDSLTQEELEEAGLK